MADFDKIGEQVGTMQQQVISMVEPLTDECTDLEARIIELDILNHDLSERLTDMQQQLNELKAERGNPQAQVQVAEQLNVST